MFSIEVSGRNHSHLVQSSSLQSSYVYERLQSDSASSAAVIAAAAAAELDMQQPFCRPMSVVPVVEHRSSPESRFVSAVDCGDDTNSGAFLLQHQHGTVDAFSLTSKDVFRSDADLMTSAAALQ